MKKFYLEIEIEAESLEAADALRDEVVGAIEDTWERERAVEATCSEVLDEPRVIPPAYLKPPSHWDTDPEFPIWDWQYEVTNGDTRLGYREWTEHQREARSDETP
jgi:hypothetical protein